MDIDPNERFSGNRAIDLEIHEILESFPEPSRSRMRKKIRQDQAALNKHRNDQTDANARHTFREFLVARQLNSQGLQLEYSKKIGKQTPDWYDQKNRLLLEVFTCERGGSSPPAERIAATVIEKVARYAQVVANNSLYFVIAVYGDFLSFCDSVDCEDAIADGNLFERYPNLSGIIFFTETNAVRVKNGDGSSRLKQCYQLLYFNSPHAIRKIDLARHCE